MNRPPLSEAQRQQSLLRVLWRQDDPSTLLPHLQYPAAALRGLLAHQAHAGAQAQRALAAAYPTLQALISADSFADLARDFWMRTPPHQADLARWGETLPDFLQASKALRSEPCLPDVARLEWAVHQAHCAADVPASTQGLETLAQQHPRQVQLVFASGSCLISSAHPVVSIWQAHQPANQPANQPATGLSGQSPAAGADATTEPTARFAQVRAAYARGQPQHALVYRQGWRVQVCSLPALALPFTRSLLRGHSLGAALEAVCEAGFDFQAWLLGGLRGGWLVGAQILPDTTDSRQKAVAAAPTPGPRV
jgi:Putative DNA-binding domain